LKELKNAEANLGSLKLREEKLNKDLDSLKHDYGIEKEIRERFPVAKEGEEVIIFVDPKEKVDIDNSNINQSFWNKFKGAFGF
jgi:cell division protein FtsB